MDTYKYICVHFYKIWIHTIILVHIPMYTYNYMSNYNKPHLIKIC